MWARGRQARPPQSQRKNVPGSYPESPSLACCEGVMRTAYLKWGWMDGKPHCGPSELAGGHWLSLQLHLEACTQICLHLSTHWGSRATVGTIITSAYRGETKVSAVSYSTVSIKVYAFSLCFTLPEGGIETPSHNHSDHIWPQAGACLRGLSQQFLE